MILILLLLILLHSLSESVESTRVLLLLQRMICFFLQLMTGLIARGINKRTCCVSFSLTRSNNWEMVVETFPLHVDDIKQRPSCSSSCNHVAFATLVTLYVVTKRLMGNSFRLFRRWLLVRFQPQSYEVDRGKDAGRRSNDIREYSGIVTRWRRLLGRLGRWNWCGCTLAVQTGFNDVFLYKNPNVL